MATTADLERWFSTAVGRGMNPDKTFGLQCKDVVDDLCIALWGNWVNTITPGNANQVYATSNGNYFEKLPANVALRRGDVVCWKEVPGNKYGHIAVVTGVGGSTYTVIEQNGFTNTRPAYIASYSTRNNVMGVLRPRLSNPAPQEAPVALTTLQDAEWIFERGLGDTTSGRWRDWVGQPLEYTFHAAGMGEEAQGWTPVMRQRLKDAEVVPGLTTQIQSQQQQIEELNKKLENVVTPEPVQVPVPVTVQVPVGLDDMSLGQLLSAAFSKLFKIK